MLDDMPHAIEHSSPGRHIADAYTAAENIVTPCMSWYKMARYRHDDLKLRPIIKQASMTSSPVLQLGGGVGML